MPKADALFSLGYKSDIIECDGGEPPASPIPTPILARNICIKLPAMPVSAVNPLHAIKESVIIFFLL